MTKSTITREQLLEIIETDHVQCGEASYLARMALAAMDDEPVAIIDQANIDYLRSGADADVWPPEREEMGDVLLYRHAQPAPEMKPVGYLFVSDQGAIAYSPTDWGMPGFRLAGQIYGDIDVESQPVPVVPDEYVATAVTPTNLAYEACWNACRAAMLAAAPHDTPALNSVQSVVTVPDKWIPVSEQKPGCWCRTCRPVFLNDMRFVVCPDCGNKRCPRANDHRNACTGSNEPGQEGSAYPAAPQEVKGE